MSNSKIKIYIPNLPYRVDRRKSVESQFIDKVQYEVSIINPVPHEEGYASLWRTFASVVLKESVGNSDYFIFCEDDHVFTKNYSWEYMEESISKAVSFNADILNGGPSKVEWPLQVHHNISG